MDETLKVCRNCQRFDWNDTLGLSFVEERQCQRNEKGKFGMLGKKDGKNVIYATNVIVIFMKESMIIFLTQKLFGHHLYGKFLRQCHWRNELCFGH